MNEEMAKLLARFIEEILKLFSYFFFGLTKNEKRAANQLPQNNHLILILIMAKPLRGFEIKKAALRLFCFFSSEKVWEIYKWRIFLELLFLKNKR